MKISVILFSAILSTLLNTKYCLDNCVNGKRIKNNNTECLCNVGWHGKKCAFCDGTAKISGNSGIIQHNTMGEPYSKNENCAWIIDTNQSMYINLEIKNFSLECNFDKLSFFVDSFLNQPELILSGHYNSGQVFSLRPNLGRILASFTSDENYSYSGFSITFHVSSCPNDCNHHGVCVDGRCRCSSEYQGSACQYKVLCRGPSCDSFINTEQAHRSAAVWQLTSSDNFAFPSRTLHASVLIDDTIYVFAGLLQSEDELALVYRYSLLNDKWTTLNPSNNQFDRPECRFGHTFLHWRSESDRHTLVMYGGVNCKSNAAMDDLWQLVVDKSDSGSGVVWSRVVNSDNHKLAGQTCHIRDDVLLCFSGFTHPLDWSPYIHRFNLSSRRWLSSINLPDYTLSKTAYSRSVMIGSSVYQFTGIKLGNVSDLIRYDLNTGQFSLLLPPSELKLSGYSLVEHEGFIYRLGGCDMRKRALTSNCLITEVLIYDTVCIRGWTTLPTLTRSFSSADKEKHLMENVTRIGHTSHLWRDPTTNRSAIVMVGGFRGSLRSEVFHLWLVTCADLSPTHCNESWKFGNRCYWNGSQCVLFSNFQANNCFPDEDSRIQHEDRHCLRVGAASSSDCLHSGHCVWCLSGDTAQCRATQLCQNVLPNSSAVDKFLVLKNKRKCSQYNTCSSCTEHYSGSCSWLLTTNRCVDNDLRDAANPLNRELTYANEFHACLTIQCNKITNCRHCTAVPFCGWCESPEKPGSGKCLFATPTSILSHNDPSTGKWVSDDSLCDKVNWFYNRNSCPKCSCNGHANCTVLDSGGAADTNQLIHPEFIEDLVNDTLPSVQLSCLPCQDNTQGRHCSECGIGYFGSSTNGDTCSKCNCGGLAYDCNKRMGSCSGYCMVVGAYGNECKECKASYLLHNNSCYYMAQINKIHTISKSVHKFFRYNRYFLVTIVSEFDKSTHLTISCTNFMKGANLTYTLFQYYNVIVKTLPCLEFEYDIRAGTYANETSIYINITADFDEEDDFKIEVAFTEINNFRFGYIFSAFTGSFVIFTSIAVIFLKLRQRFILARNQRYLEQQQQQMAKRPFPQIELNLFDDELSLYPGKQSSCPSIDQSVVAGIQPLIPAPPGSIRPTPNTNKSEVCVFSVFIQLPSQEHLNNNYQEDDVDKASKVYENRPLVFGSCLGVMGVHGRKEFDDTSRKLAAKRSLEVSDEVSATTLQDTPRLDVRNYQRGVSHWTQFTNLFQIRRMRRLWTRNRNINNAQHADSNNDIATGTSGSPPTLVVGNSTDSAV